MGLIVKKSAILICIISAVVIILTIYKIQYNNGDYKTKVFTAMDTAVSISIPEKQFNDTMYKSIKAEINRLNSLFDSYDEGGEIYDLNKNRKLECSENTADIISKTLALQKKYKNVDISSGRLISLWNFQSESPKVPKDENIIDSLKTINSGNIHIDDNCVSIEGDTKIDLSAVAKGYACDIVKNELKRSDIGCAVISFGSSTLLYGEKPNGGKFSVAVRVPESDSEQYVGNLNTKSCIISSSGGYERYFKANGKTYSHILDLKTGYPVNTDLASVTVVSQNGLLTDFLSTEIYIGGTGNINSYLNNKNYSVIAISDDNKIYISDSIKNSFKITNSEYSFY